MFPPFYKMKTVATAVLSAAIACWTQAALGQTGTAPGDPSFGLRPVQPGSSLPSTSVPPMVPLNSTGPMGFDPYAPTTNSMSGSGGVMFPPPAVPASSLPPSPATTAWPTTTWSSPYSTYQPGSPQTSVPGGVYPSYTGPPPVLPGAGPSAVVQSSPSLGPYPTSSPGLYPNSTPSALFPGSYNYTGTGGMFGDWWGSSGFGAGTYPGATPYGAPGYNPNLSAAGAVSPYGTNPTAGYNWNPPGTAFGTPYGQTPEFIRLCQGPRFRHAYIHGNHDADALAINDTDVAIAFVIPQFLFSNQPLYLLPSFSFHQWSGPRHHLDPDVTADLPSKAFSAFLDTGWQSDPVAIFGAELGLRLGVFSDFDSVGSDSFRILGRAIGRVRLTPQSTLKLGVMYLDRNRVQWLPAGGILWQPNPGTRLDLFFPEPKLSAFLTTLGSVDTWWYVAGYYGGGAWTIRREDGSEDFIDINDIRIVAGLEWGRNEMMRDGRRMGFAEIGYAFDRELLYKRRPADNLDLQNNFVIRVGFGY